MSGPLVVAVGVWRGEKVSGEDDGYDSSGEKDGEDEEDSVIY